jgi:diguanylate cyclase (GGDEF)-like protein
MPAAKPHHIDLQMPKHSVLRALDSGQGLPSNQIHKIARDSRGRLWLAGPAGLACFDGQTLLMHDRRNGLACQGLRSVAIGAQGVVWVGTDLGLEAIDAQGQPLSWMGWSRWSYGLVECINVVGAEIWVGGAHGVVCIDPQGGKGPEVTFQADIGFVRDVLPMSDATLLAASDSLGVVRIAERSWRPMQVPALAGRWIKRLAQGRPGELLVGTDAGVSVIDVASGAERHVLRVEGSANEVTALACGHNEVWVAFGSEVAAFSHDEVMSLPVTRHTLPSRVNDIHLDNHGNVWLATDTAGLHRVSCLRHAIKQINLGVPGAVFSIKAQPDAALDIGGENMNLGLSLSASAQAEVQCRAMPAATTVWDSLHTPEGHWLATHAGLYFAGKNSNYRRIGAHDPVLSAPARVLLARDDSLWVGTLRGLARLRDVAAEQGYEVRASDGQSFGYVYALHLDSQQRLWVATLGRGLWRETETGWMQVTVAPLTAQGNTYVVQEGPTGEILVVQDEQVVLLQAQGQQARLLQTAFPVAGWAAQWLDEQRIAIGASDGLRVVRSDNGHTMMRVQSLLDAQQWEFTNNRALLREGADRLLCGVNGGLVRVDLLRLQSLIYPPTVRLLDLKLDGVVQRVERGRCELAAGRWTLNARVSAAWLIDPPSVRFRFKLDSFDAQWSDLRAEPQTTYTCLPPGEYSLLVQAWSPLTGAGEEVEVCVIVVRAARNLLDTLRTSLRAPLAPRLDEALPQHELAARNAEMEQTLKLRDQQLQTGNEALQRASAELDRISPLDSLTGLLRRRSFDAVLVQELRRAERLRVPVSLLLMSLDHFRQANEALGVEQADAHLRTVAQTLKQQLRDATDTAARFGGDELAVVLAGAYAEEAARLAQRVQNALQVLALPNPGAPGGVLTASYGVAAVNLGERLSQAQWLARVHQTVKHAKQAGRNRLTLWSAALDAAELATPSAPLAPAAASGTPPD